jgi:serine/threonine-protein phosphatase with EF-hand domain
MSVDLRKSRDINNALTAVLNCVEMEEERHFVSTADLFNDLFQAYSLKVDPTKVVEVETSYVGLHLGEYEASDFERLITSFSNFENLHALYTLKIINDAKELLKKLPNIQKCSLNCSSDNLVLVGDLHGNFRDLKYIISKYGIPGSKYKFIFNGDFVDRGRQQIEVLLTILYAFLLHPDRVFLNRGNHEDISMNTHSKFYPNFFLDIHDKYDDYSHMVFEAAENLFIYLPLATIVENNSGLRVFVTHGIINIVLI